VGLDSEVRHNFEIEEEVDRFFRRFKTAALQRRINLESFIGGRVLDAGCGFGYLVMHLQKRGIDCYGIDLDSSAVRKAKESVKHPEKIVLADIANAPFEEEFFDLVISNMVYNGIDTAHIFKHLGDKKERFMNGVYTVTKKGGLYLIRDAKESIRGVHFGKFKVWYINKDGFITEGILEKCR
jgi:SAM-dependent methyltransferase